MVIGLLSLRYKATLFLYKAVISLIFSHLSRINCWRFEIALKLLLCHTILVNFHTAAWNFFLIIFLMLFGNSFFLGFMYRKKSSSLLSWFLIQRASFLISSESWRYWVATASKSLMSIVSMMQSVFALKFTNYWISWLNAEKAQKHDPGFNVSKWVYLFS